MTEKKAEPVYAITESIVRMVEQECFKAGETIEGQDNCNSCKYEPKTGPRKGCCNFGKEEIAALLRSSPISCNIMTCPGATDMCMERNGAQGGQEPPTCTQNHHNDDGTLIVSTTTIMRRIQNVWRQAIPHDQRA